MPSRKRPPGAHSRIEFLAERQLTLGECLAIARYGQHAVEATGSISAGELLKLVDELAVCTTCGWTRVLHTADPQHRAEMGVCTRYAPRCAQGD